MLNIIFMEITESSQRSFRIAAMKQTLLLRFNDHLLNIV